MGDDTLCGAIMYTREGMAVVSARRRHGIEQDVYHDGMNKRFANTCFRLQLLPQTHVVSLLIFRRSFDDQSTISKSCSATRLAHATRIVLAFCYLKRTHFDTRLPHVASFLGTIIGVRFIRAVQVPIGRVPTGFPSVPHLVFFSLPNRSVLRGSCPPFVAEPKKTSGGNEKLQSVGASDGWRTFFAGLALTDFKGVSLVTKQSLGCLHVTADGTLAIGCSN